jgi:PKD repeat protein
VNWGDGRTENFTGTPSAISHAYAAQGIYLVVVTGFDALDDTSTASKSITVIPRPLPTVSFTVSDNPTVNSVVTFTITATATPGSVITSVAIDFGDNQSTTLPGTAKTVQHVYDKPSPQSGYTVTVTATDSTGASASASAVLVVK